MSSGYDGPILVDHLATHMIYLSTASSLWYSIESSYDHEFHLLSETIDMSPEAYGHLLVAANHAQLQPSWCFSIMTRTRIWHQFIDNDGDGDGDGDGGRFSACDRGTFELDFKKINL